MQTGIYAYLYIITLITVAVLIWWMWERRYR